MSGNVKTKRPQPKKVLDKTKKARIALASGQISQAEKEVKRLRDLRTLYVKFKKNLPTNLESMKWVFLLAVKWMKQNVGSLIVFFRELFPQSQCVRGRQQEKPDAEFKVRLLKKKKMLIAFVSLDFSFLVLLRWIQFWSGMWASQDPIGGVKWPLLCGLCGRKVSQCPKGESQSAQNETRESY